MTLTRQPRCRKIRMTCSIERGQVAGLLRFLGVKVPTSRYGFRGRRYASFWLAPVDHLGLFEQAHRNWRQAHKTAVNGEAVLLNLALDRLEHLFRQRGFEV